MKKDEISSTEDLFRILDSLFRDESAWWDQFYADNERCIPFDVPDPDENLAGWFESGLVAPKRVLELGCGLGRNAIFMAKRGCNVDAADISQVALEIARKRAAENSADVRFRHESIFSMPIVPGYYDLVYDAGCFHHILPHRRWSYLDLVARALKPSGTFGLVCFNEEGGSGLSDAEIYLKRSMGGGKGYSAERLERIFSVRFDILELRPMKKQEKGSRRFGEDYLLAALMALKPSGGPLPERERNTLSPESFGDP